MMQCPSCARIQEPRIVCLDCGAPIAADLDLFAALSVSRELQIDLARLERAYHDLGRRIHPDRFTSSPLKLRDASLRATATLTRAYRTLRDPVSRGLYWLELNGRKLRENNQRVPQELAELVFEVQEQIADLRAAREPEGQGMRELGAEVAARRVDLQQTLDGLFVDLNAIFARFDAAGEHDRDPLFAQLKSTLSQIAYMRTLIRDVDRELGSARAA
jgi:molecular chaperone HscB